MKRVTLFVFSLLFILGSLSPAAPQQVIARCKIATGPGQSCEDAIRRAEEESGKPPGLPNQQEPRDRKPGVPQQSADPRQSRPAVVFSPNGTPVIRSPYPQGPISGSTPGSDALERVMRRAISPDVRESIERQLGSVRTGHCMGSPNCDRFFDRGIRGTGIDDVTAPAPDRIFKGPSVFPGPAPVQGTFKPVTPSAAEQIRREYGTIPGGVVLEGEASGFGRIGQVQYDGRYNAFTLDDRAVYFSPVNARNVAILARAIAQDDRVGVSLGQVQLVYGAVPENSEVAIDLKVADSFLGDIVFARRKWTKGYNLQSGYEPQSQSGDFNVAVFFNLNGFQFATVNEEIQLTGVNFNATLVPLTESSSAEGGHLPDLDAISSGRRFPQYESNARHVSDNINYYRREKIVDQAFAYGEVASFLRGLKTSGVDLRRVASAVEWSTGITPTAARSPAPDVAEMRRPIDNLFDAWRRVDLSEYLAQWAPDAVKYVKNERIEFTELRNSRAILFPQIVASAAVHSPIYRGYSNGVARFDSIYSLAIRLQDGRVSREEKVCESYTTAKRANRWVITENRDSRPCEEIDESLQAESTENERRLENAWRDYLKQIQAHRYYANWSGPPYDLYTGSTRRDDFPERDIYRSALSYTSLVNRDVLGDDLRVLKNVDQQSCIAACNREPACRGYSFDRWNSYCFLKSGINVVLIDPRSTSGIREHVTIPPIAAVPVNMERLRSRMFPGTGYRTTIVSSFESCEATCKQDEECIAFTFAKSDRVCRLFSSTGEYFPNKLTDSGIKRQAP